MILLSVSTENEQAVSAAVRSEYRLHELVTVTPAEAAAADLAVDELITTLPDWKNRQPPILFAPAPFSPQVLTGLIYARLGNTEKAAAQLAGHDQLHRAVMLHGRLQQGIPLPVMEITATDYFDLHNLAIALHYGFAQQEVTFEQVQLCYQNALALAVSNEYRAFTARHYAVLLTDAGLLTEAESCLQEMLVLPLAAHIQTDIQQALCQVWMKQLTIPYDTALLEKLKTTLWECLQYYELHQQSAEAGLILTDAAHIATISNSFSEALGYCNRAIALLEAEGLDELAAHAQLRKGALLQVWAQNGNPQFFRTAMQAYQHALKVFTREDAPAVFADIQHQLGKIYAEIPDEIKKKGMWAAISVASFTEALNFYNKIDYPYEFAMICHSFGTAHTKYPLALHSDNYDKALAWYREALDIRTAAAYPFERVLTLSNYLEASWFAGNKTEFDENRYQDMVATANEILLLSTDAAVCEQAKMHLEKLAELKQAATAVN